MPARADFSRCRASEARLVAALDAAAGEIQARAALRLPFRALPSHFGPEMEAIVASDMRCRVTGECGGGILSVARSVSAKPHDHRKREWVVALYRAGESIGAIATRLGMSKDTVTWHLRISGVSVLEERVAQRVDEVECCALRLRAKGAEDWPLSRICVTFGWALAFAREARARARDLRNREIFAQHPLVAAE
ncbi:helix-turn-helix transcriptional regulator [Paracoccus litorisediminis]|uniref:Uncharacterized protein n=1 Tax=Paracoccus litorisediminis TaxID=2006130 RepID=A0A844HUX7_9RHOB|nr:helix-turn-helix transcriptional regulator [Paracoccus litorisediminis]MTH62147.1 hypothetical protein [Paracoccus litorisediminis]